MQRCPLAHGRLAWHKALTQGGLTVCLLLALDTLPVSMTAGITTGVTGTKHHRALNTWPGLDLSPLPCPPLDPVDSGWLTSMQLPGGLNHQVEHSQPAPVKRDARLMTSRCQGARSHPPGAYHKAGVMLALALHEHRRQHDGETACTLRSRELLQEMDKIRCITRCHSLTPV